MKAHSQLKERNRQMRRVKPDVSCGRRLGLFIWLKSLFKFTPAEEPPLCSANSQDTNSSLVNDEQNAEDVRSFSEEKLAELDVKFVVLMSERTTLRIVFKRLERLFKPIEPPSCCDRCTLRSPVTIPRSDLGLPVAAVRRRNSFTSLRRRSMS